jgi:hypothetical protein
MKDHTGRWTGLISTGVMLISFYKKARRIIVIVHLKSLRREGRMHWHRENHRNTTDAAGISKGFKGSSPPLADQGFRERMLQ